MTPNRFYKTFITSLLKGTVTYYVAYYDNTALRNYYEAGSEHSNRTLELIITKLSDYIYKIRVYRNQRTEEERLRIAKYDFE